MRVPKGERGELRRLANENYLGVFEDDFDLVWTGFHTGRVCEALLAQATRLPGILWLGASSPASTGDILSSMEFRDISVDSALRPVRLRMVQTKVTYGSFACLIRKHVLAHLLQATEPSTTMHSSDGALRNAITAQGVLGAHLEIWQADLHLWKAFNMCRHRPPGEVGRERIH